MDTPRHLPLPTVLPETLHQRAGDLERNAVCDELAAHFAAGRLRADELESRLGAAVAAPTVAELRRLLSDLPAGPSAAAVSVAPSVTPVGVRWSALDVAALLAVIGSVAFAALAGLLLGVRGDSALLAACLVGGVVAAVGGAALTHLAHRGRGVDATPTDGPAGQRPRMA